MVSVVQQLNPGTSEANVLDRLCAGLHGDDNVRVARALTLAQSLYLNSTLGTGESSVQHATGTALIAAHLALDANVRVAALLFAVPEHGENSDEILEPLFGDTVVQLVSGLHRLGTLRPLTRALAESKATAKARTESQPQTEILRKMLLAMVDDIRVVLLRLASRVQTLRYLNAHPGQSREEVARESLLIYAPLANRLGVWQLKWELEDLAFRYLEPETYQRIAALLDEKRREREEFITLAVGRLCTELAEVGVDSEVYGRPKHIVSIWNKMRSKNLSFDALHDLRAVRILVDSVDDCYTALGVVHHLWQPIIGEFDDYIAQPKPNNYRSLHTAVRVEDGRSLEVQIRTREMHAHAELGVAAHWRYKEGAVAHKGGYEDKIAWLRQLLQWRDEITDSEEWVNQFRQAELDDTIYVLTPQDKVVDLPRGATGLDFAYRLHTDLGHRCRGVKVDGHMVPLNTVLRNGQRVEITSVKVGGPSRDWLNPNAGYLTTARARLKVKRWFVALEEAEALAQGRAAVLKELQRHGQKASPKLPQVNLDELAVKLGVKGADALFLAVSRGEIGMRAIDLAVRLPEPAAPLEPEIQARKSRLDGATGQQAVLVVGVDKLLTQLARCCKPMPPDAITGFVTRGKGVSIHRGECLTFSHLASRNPERVIACEWGHRAEKAVYPADILVEAVDRQGLLRDVSDILSREKINITAAKTQSRSGLARMALTLELADVEALRGAMHLLSQIRGVTIVQRK